MYVDHSSYIQRDDGACIPRDPGNADYAAYLDWVAAGNTPAQPVAPPVEQRMAALQAAVQAHLDGQAQALNYDDIRTAVTYADEPAVPKFQAEGQALRAWRSVVWAKCYEILAQWQADQVAEPSSSELIAMLPAPDLPN